MLPPPTPSYPSQHQHIPLSSGHPPVSGYPSFSSNTGRLNHYSHPPSTSAVNLHNHHQPQYPPDHDLPPVVSNPATSGSGHGHYPQPHSYFGPPPPGVGPGPYPSQGAQHHGRRSISPVPIMPNGHVQSGKSNGGWLGSMHKRSNSNEWIAPDGRRHDVAVIDVEEDGMRARDIRREKDRMRDRDREREQHEYEREHERERMHHVPPPLHRHSHPGPPPQHQHVHAPPAPGAHHIIGSHHHHHHHHHVVHNHHSPPGPGAGHAVPPPPGHGPALSPRVNTSRDFELSRSQSGPSRPTEIINLSSKPPMSSSWKGDDFPAPLDARKHVGRPSSGPPILDERERTLAMPFVMNSHAASRDPSVSGPPNGTSTVSPPRNSWNSADDSSYRIPQSQSAPSSFLGSADSHGHSPGHRYTNSAPHMGRGPPPPPPPPARQNSIGLSPPRPRPFPPSPSASATYIGSSRSPNRYGQSSIHGPGPSPPLSHGSSIATSPNMKTRRPGSPVLSGKLAMSPGAGFSPRSAGPARTATPANIGSSLDLNKAGGPVGSGGNTTGYGIGSRTASPLMTYLSPHPAQPSRTSMNSNGIGHAERHHESPHLPPLAAAQKMAVAQIVDGR